MSDNALEVQQVHFNIATYTFQLHALSREVFCTMCIPSRHRRRHSLSFEANLPCSKQKIHIFGLNMVIIDCLRISYQLTGQKSNLIFLQGSV